MVQLSFQVFKVIVEKIVEKLSASLNIMSAQNNINILLIVTSVL